MHRTPEKSALWRYYCCPAEPNGYIGPGNQFLEPKTGNNISYRPILSSKSTLWSNRPAELNEYVEPGNQFLERKSSVSYGPIHSSQFTLWSSEGFLHRMLPRFCRVSFYQWFDLWRNPSVFLRRILFVRTEVTKLEFTTTCSRFGLIDLGSGLGLL